MVSSINKPCVAAIAVALALSGITARADFDEATKAYLLGQFEQARYEALIAATDGNPKAQMLLGQLYFNGEGVPKDIPHALHWYNKAAEKGFADAQYRLGLLYHDGNQGVERNYDIAYKWLSKALESGIVAAREKLEWLFKTEQGNVVNLNENIEVLKQVAASGNQQARFLLSQKMLKGADIPQDKASAVKMLREDAEVGFVKAQKQLGELFYYGDGLEKDYIEAYAWSMAYAGTKELGGIAREGKQTARSALRKLPEEDHEKAYIKSREYFESYVMPFHKNAREVGPDKYRIVVRSEVKKDSAGQQSAAQQTAAQQPVVQQSATQQPTAQQPTAQQPTTPQPADKPDSTGGGVSGGPAPSVPSASLAESVSGSVSGNESQTAASSQEQAEQQRKSGQGEPPLSSTESQADLQQEPAKAEATPATIVNAPIPEPSTDVETVAGKERKTSQEQDAGSPDVQSVGGPVSSREDVEIIPAEPAVVSEEKVAPANTKESAERKFEDVYNVLVRKKSALYQLYTREYELDKKLEGRIVFEIVVSPDGKISTVEIISNTLESPTLEQEFIDYLKANVSFEPADVADFKISYPVDFLPPQ